MQMFSSISLFFFQGTGGISAPRGHFSPAEEELATECPGEQGPGKGYTRALTARARAAESWQHGPGPFQLAELVLSSKTSFPAQGGPMSHVQSLHTVL